MKSAATFQIYKIQVNNEYEPPFRGAGGQKRQEVSGIWAKRTGEPLIIME
jgi:hypothetical protein